MKVDSDRFNILKNGSRHGYFCEPHRTVCSRTWGTPVLSVGVVRNCTLRPGETAPGEAHASTAWLPSSLSYQHASF
ncbi:hypothetical protein PAL_GLEAN10000010 [Pteropus alecto]|uniref:Uncharacterized protein n=1 Tax=Pteropus alecto TaxID=9402 RepID=L5K6I7_PTEAL|nr:hypothetical protein PAL_GLEAN10000010 [Pteropus alecto]